MINLLKKDILIIRKMAIIIILLAILTPLGMAFLASDVSIPGGAILTILEILFGVMFLSSIYEEEEKYPKASSLITTIGYSRKTQVIERFILIVLVVTFCTLIYVVETLFIKQLLPLSLEEIVIASFISVILLSFYTVITIRFGVRMGRYINVAVILTISLGPTLLKKFGIVPSFDLIKGMNSNVLYFILIAAMLSFWLISYKISLMSYERKEL